MNDYKIKQYDELLKNIDDSITEIKIELKFLSGIFILVAALVLYLVLVNTFI